MAQHENKHHHQCQQVLDMFKDEGRLSEPIWFTGTTETPHWKWEKYSHVFYHKPAKDNKPLLYDLGNRDHQKNYADVSRKPLEFQVGSKCLANEPLAIPLDEIQIDEKLHFIEEPVEIMDREVKRLKQSRILIVKEMLKAVHYEVLTLTIERLPLLSLPIVFYVFLS
nr:oxoglutarate/iron-dependent dioxygenase [Tanacetum cinerariifolium]